MNENMAKQCMDEIFSWFYVSYLFMLPFIQFHIDIFVTGMAQRPNLDTKV